MTDEIPIMQTPHIKCFKGDFAEIVLLPGDPLVLFHKYHMRIKF